MTEVPAARVGRLSRLGLGGDCSRGALWWVMTAWTLRERRRGGGVDVGDAGSGDGGVDESGVGEVGVGVVAGVLGGAGGFDVAVDSVDGLTEDALSWAGWC